MIDLMGLMTTGEVARELGLSEALVRHYAREGRLSRVPSPHGSLFERLEVERFRRDRAAKAAAAPAQTTAR